MANYSVSDQTYANLLLELEKLNKKIDKFVNGSASDLVQTDGGPVRTLAGIEAKALENRWMLKVVDYKTVKEAELYIVNYAEGQLFRIWGECENSPNRNGMYMKQGVKLVRINWQEINDIVDPEIPDATTTVRRHSWMSFGDTPTNLSLGDFKPGFDYVIETKVVGRNVDAGLRWVYVCERGGVITVGDDGFIQYVENVSTPDYSVIVGVNAPTNRIAVKIPDPQPEGGQVVIEAIGDARRVIEWYSETKTVILKRPETPWVYPETFEGE